MTPKPMDRTSGGAGPAALNWCRRAIAQMATGVDHREVSERVAASGALGGGYLMMTAISAAIAILGLLLSSPAVVIGAMLLSPLMGPIILLGFSFWMVDWGATRKAVISLGAGFGIALLVSILLTVLSPLKEPTAEILARSRPTLFDLLVAVFSGVAGGYAVVRHKGEAVIGVAIATALMPPLAVVGFGLGTGSWSVAGGALLLFFTNLIAIALAAAVMAALNGFRPRVHLAEGGWTHHLGVLVILAGLCIPLTLSLRRIALESRANAQTRADVARLFGPKARLASLTVRGAKDGIDVEGLVATPVYVDDPAGKLTREMQAQLHAPVRVNIDQVVLADPRALKPTAAQAPGAPATPDPASTALAILRAAVPFAGAQIAYDAKAGGGVVMLDSKSGLDLSGSRALETALRARLDGANTVVIPPVKPLPPLTVEPGESGGVDLGDSAAQRWALARWRSTAVEARLCRNGVRGLPTAAVQAALTQAFAPSPLTLKPIQGADCPSTNGASILLAPGVAPPGTPPAAKP